MMWKGRRGRRQKALGTWIKLTCFFSPITRFQSDNLENSKITKYLGLVHKLRDASHGGGWEGGRRRSRREGKLWQISLRHAPQNTLKILIFRRYDRGGGSKKCHVTRYGIYERALIEQDPKQEVQYQVHLRISQHTHTTINQNSDCKVL